MSFESNRENGWANFMYVKHHGPFPASRPTTSQHGLWLEVLPANGVFNAQIIFLYKTSNKQQWEIILLSSFHKKSTSFIQFTGYCFSASLPPLLTAAAIKALEKIDEHPDMLIQLRERSINLHKNILQSQLTEKFTLKSDLSSPLKHLYLKDQTLSYTEQQLKLQNIVDYVSNFSL